MIHLGSLVFELNSWIFSASTMRIFLWQNQIHVDQRSDQDWFYRPIYWPTSKSHSQTSTDPYEKYFLFSFNHCFIRRRHIIHWFKPPKQGIFWCFTAMFRYWLFKIGNVYAVIEYFMCVFSIFLGSEAAYYSLLYASSTATYTTTTMATTNGQTITNGNIRIVFHVFIIDDFNEIIQNDHLIIE